MGKKEEKSEEENTPKFSLFRNSKKTKENETQSLTMKNNKTTTKVKKEKETSTPKVDVKKLENEKKFSSKNEKASKVKTEKPSKSSKKSDNTKILEPPKQTKETSTGSATPQTNVDTLKVELMQKLNNGGTSNKSQSVLQKVNKEHISTKPVLKSEKSSLSLKTSVEKPEKQVEKSKQIGAEKQAPSVKVPAKTEVQDPIKETTIKVKKPEVPKKPSFNSRPGTPTIGERCGSWRPSDMVTMSSEKAAARRKTDSNNGAAGSGAPAAAASNNEDSPNQLVYKKMEQIVEKMQDEATGVPVKTVKSFMSKIPSVFTGSDLIMWMMKNLDVEDQAEALHLAHLMAAHGYFFPIDDHMLTVKNDNTFYRFQTPYFWPSNCWEPENTDYAVYLCKRTMQNKTRLELADYEAENLARLQKMFSRKWEFIFMQAEAQSKVDKKRDKLERKVLDSQERAFWDVHRPMPGCVNTTEVDIKKACRVNKPLKSSRHLQLGVAGGRISPSTSETDLASPTEAVKRHIAMLKQRLDRRNIKVSKVAEACIGYFEQYAEYDPFFTPPELPNPWVSDSPEYWEQERMAKDISARRVKRWAFSLQELLQDPVGREHFIKFLDKEFSGENLKFWEAVQQLKALPQKDVQDKVDEIWKEFLAPDASCPINVDSQSYETTKKNMENLDRWSFDVAAAHVYHLMKSDSYSRYLRSEMYKEFLNGSKKKTSVKGIRSIVSFSARKESALS